MKHLLGAVGKVRAGSVVAQCSNVFVAEVATGAGPLSELVDLNAQGRRVASRLANSVIAGWRAGLAPWWEPGPQ